jgi:hypothetical protein
MLTIEANPAKQFNSLTDSDKVKFLSSLTAIELDTFERSLADEHHAGRGHVDERDLQAQRMADKRSAARDLVILSPKEPNRRRDALANGEMFLTTYFADVFFEPFTTDRTDMHQSIVHAARYGGDQAIAGTRGEGKTKLAIYTALYLTICGLSVFPIVIGKNQRKSEAELRTVREKLQQSKLLIEDFPELALPFQTVGGWSSRARMQTVRGEYTNLKIAADHIIFPTIGEHQLPGDWPDDMPSVSNGQIIASIGIDGGIRGINYRDVRPDIAIIDDIEDRQAADSDALIEKNEEIIEQDIGGLASSAERVARVFLCTIQNRKCVAFKFTDPKQKPSWKGKRYRKMIKPPDRMDLVNEYLRLRIERENDDPDARVAFRYWKENRAEIERDCVISNPSSYSKKQHEDGDPLELSAVQSYYNKVADLGEKAVATEIDNDPPEEVGPQGSGLTWQIVAGRLSGLDRGQLPANASCITASIDLGKYLCHWVVVAWWKGAGGVVIDYGRAEVAGTDRAMDNEASEPMIYRALLNWRDELLAKQYVDAAGSQRSVDAVFIDSGTFTDAAYEFVRNVGGAPFYCSKGIGNYRDKTTETDKIKPGNHFHAAYQEAQGLWLYEMNTSYWKQFIHERFLTPTFDEQNFLRRGALSLFVQPNNRKHTSFAQHIVAEELVSEFKEGKGVKTYWNVVNANNHWLDATYMAAAAASARGIYLLAPTAGTPDGPIVTPRPKAEHEQAKKQKPAGQRHGAPKKRNGGWVKSLRGR